MNEKKFCPNCGKEIESNVEYCANCGTKLEPGKKLENKEKKHKRKGVIIGVIVGILILVCVIPKGKTDTTEKISVTENNNDASNTVQEDVAEKTDLYTIRKATEDVLISNLGFEKNEYGMYPDENNFMIMCMDGNVYSITLTDNDKENYSFLGISVGDNYNDKKENLNSFYTYIDTYATEDNTFQDIFADNEYGMLSISYDMNNSIIKSIGYVAEEAPIIDEEPITDEAETTQMDTDDINNIDVDYFIYEELRQDRASTYGEGTCYSIVDIDGDGIYEMIVSYGTCDADWANDVYTIDGDLVYLGTFYRPVNLFYADTIVTNDGNGIIAVSGHGGVENIDQITKNGDSLSVVTVVNTEIEPDSDYYANEMYIESVPITDGGYIPFY